MANPIGLVTFGAYAITSDGPNLNQARNNRAATP
jgi:hypothetical protein